jgi:hypothetical protein
MKYKLQGGCRWQIHVQTELVTICENRFERSIGKLCYHNLIPHDYDFIADK